MKETDIAYLAGIIDGEGTIQIIRQKSRRNQYVTGAVYISNSSVTLLEWIQVRFGGNITKARQRTGKNWKPVYRLQFYGETAEKVAEQVLPYLVIKKEQAILFLDLRSRMKTFLHPLTADERVYRESLACKCQVLNSRGLKDAERLNELAPPAEGDAIVRSHGNHNHEKSAEMTDSAQVGA